MHAQQANGNYGFGTTLPVPFAEAIARTTDALKAEGFGVLTTIDVRETMKAKLGVEMEPYVILGACNPQLAHQGLQAEPNLGLLLPCNVTVREVDGRSEILAVDPATMLGVVGQNPALEQVAAEASIRLRRVVSALGRDSA
jgi:uncharacterized protein (DUF302 family)